MKKYLTVGAVAAAIATAFMAFGPTATAQEATFRTPGFISGEPGSTVLLNEVAVPAELVGKTCELSDIVQNNESVHIGNDLIITTGSTVAVFDNYEDTPFKVTEASGFVELGPTIKFELRFGPDGITSKGNTFTVNCDPTSGTPPAPEPTTTTAPPAPEPSEPTTPEPPPAGPTTTAPPTPEPPPAGPTTVAPTTPEPPPAGPTTTTTAPPTPTTEPPPLGPAPTPPAVGAQPPLAG